MKLRRPGDVARLGLMASAAIVLFVFESLAPKPLPWMKLGLGNLPVLVSLLSFGSGPALAVSAVKLVVGGLLSGGLAGPAFVIGGQFHLGGAEHLGCLLRRRRCWAYTW